MAYTKVNFTNGSTPLNQATMDKLDQGIKDAHDLISAAGGGVDYENAWVAGTPYASGDVVNYQGVEYLAVNPSTGATPPATSPLPLPPSPTGQDGKWLTVSGGAMAWQALPAVTNANLPGRLQESGPVITDCNLTTLSGWYVVNTAASGSPDPATYHLLHVLRSDGLNSVRQFAYDYNSDRSWMRRQTSGAAWTAWQRPTVTGMVTAAGAIGAGSGFTVSRSGVGRYGVTFPAPFIYAPAVTISVFAVTGNEATTMGQPTTYNFGVNVNDAGVPVDRGFNFIAMAMA